MVRRCGILTLTLLYACGRLDFGDNAGRDAALLTGDAPPDGVDAASSSLIHQYSLAGTADDLGGPSLVSHGGTFGQTGYAFAQNQGLTLADAVPPAVYTIDIVFAFDTVTGYNKLIDFKGASSDAGLYVFDAALQFVVIPITGCPGMDCFTSPASLFTPTTMVQVTTTRDATGHVTDYVDRVKVLEFDDAMTVGAFDSSNAVAEFFIDDTVTSIEASSGLARRIRIYDTALTASQITP